MVLRYALLLAILATLTAATWLAVSAPPGAPQAQAKAAQAALCLGSGMGCGVQGK